MGFAAMSLASNAPLKRPLGLSTVVAITGATGSVLGFALVKALLELDEPVELIISGKSYQVIFEEMGLPLPKNSDTQKTEILNYLGIDTSRYGHLLTCYQNNQLGAPSASGSYLTRGMVVIPCSMATLGKMAAGISDNLVARAADVTLKERRPLIIVPRESPFNRIHLENMLRLDATGAVILPPVLSFYQPVFQSIEGQIAYTVGKVLDHLGLTQHDTFPRWGAQSSDYSLPSV
jgi:flavin prenyltransferase